MGMQTGWQEISGGVHAWVFARGSWGESNAGLVVGDGGEALLIDTQWDEPATRRMLAAAPLGAATIDTLVNTHPDGDHTWGNAVVGAPRIVATDACVAHFDHEDPQRLGRLVALSGVLGRVPVLRLPGPGRALPQGQLLLRYLAEMGRPWEFGGVSLTWPTETFSGELTLDVGGRRVDLIEVGPAHSHGDLIAHLPEEDVVFAADTLFVGVAPIMWVGPLTNWVAALERIKALRPKVVVPGHGPVSGLAEVDLLIEHFAWVAEVGAAQRAAGRSPLDAATDALRSTECASSPWAGWVAPERLVVTLTALEREAGGAPPIEGIRQRAALMTQMAVLADRVARAA
ncbi:MAG: MBL fold metallo-hydrolase [Solirubrobacteraceae bacterium]|nr:MBL fold metallo-hydrolase [Solirubrobacteraceae bacterium]